eukprot:GFUD01003255.1.p1 GENE.GFUD01003255.1~~GFUD01003255.1.p1  ORF type:complete len:1061 (+),score=210.03 GFUD01003255.1:285-3467(+)
MNGVTLVLSIVIVVILCQDVSSLLCAGNTVGTCQCANDKEGNTQFHCPSFKPDKKKFDMLVKEGEFAQVNCVHGASSEEIFSFLNELQVGNVKTLKFKGCPFPAESYQQAMEKMGISEVQRLWISGVRGKSVDKKLMRNLTVKALDLLYFDNLEVSKDLFQNSTNIQILTLNGNRGLKLSKDAFNNLPRLRTLGLSSCGISTLDGEVFTNLTNLEQLNLHGNKLEELPDGIFDDLANLTKINLGGNKLRTLPKNVFLYNDHISEAIISFNCFQSFPEHLFAEKKKLGVFDLRRLNYKRNGKCGNNSAVIDLPETMFQNSSVKEIKFLNIHVKGIPEDFLKGCKELKSIIMQSGYIKAIPKNLFKDTPIVEKIDFVNNEITEFDEDTLKGLTKLSSLRLMLNNISVIVPEIFTDLTNLKTLNLAKNNIEDISDEIFKLTPKLQDLDLSHNKLTRLPDGFEGQFSVLKNLKISKNLINSFNIEVITRFSDLLTLDLSANIISGILDITRIDSNRSDDIIIDLSRNRLERVHLTKKSMQEKKVKFLLSNNPLVCDCFATEIKQLDEETKKIYSRDKQLINQKDFRCANNKNLLETSYSDLNCPFPSEILNENCPPNCTCSLNRYSRRISVNCAGQALTQIPLNLPAIPVESDGTILHLENNLLVNLTENLERLSSNNLSNFERISELHLSSNKLKYVDHKFLPARLEYIGLDNNNIQFYSNETIQYFQKKVKQSNLSLKFGNNPYDCNCNSLELLHFLKKSYSHVEDFNDLTIKCLDKTKNLFTQNKEDFCSPNFPLLTALIPAIIMCIVIILLLVLHIYYKETIIIYVFSTSWGKIFFSEDLVDKNKPYDAFLSYSHHDSEFVEKILLPGLESELNPKELQYKCLIHTRDWNVGEMISEQIIESVDTSRRTIIVLSKGYIQSMWTRLEFKAAHTKAMKDNTQRVIIILHGEKPLKEELDDDLQRYITSNTYIDTNDPWFWKKLRYALPKKSRKQKEKPKKLHDKSNDKAVFDKAGTYNVHDKSANNPNQDKVQLPYYKQFSSEFLLPSESLKRDLEGTEYIV